MEPNTLDIILYVRVEGNPEERAEKVMNLMHDLRQNPDIVSVDWEPVSS